MPCGMEDVAVCIGQVFFCFRRTTVTVFAAVKCCETQTLMEWMFETESNNGPEANSVDEVLRGVTVLRKS